MAKVAKKAAKKKASTTTKPKPVVVDIEKELATAHKMHSEAGFQLVTMLATRRLSMKRIEEACVKTRAAADHMDQLFQLLKENTK